jgi:pimeloyl-ACP methyl ester carboxylesterase
MKQTILNTLLFMGLLIQGKAQTRSHGLVDYHQTAPTRFVEAGDARYAYRTLGTATGIPLILLQMFGGTMDDWDPSLTNELASHYKIILFDNKGVASSTGQTPNTIEEMATDARAFIKALGYKKVNLLGFSLGGAIAQQIILDEPDLVDKLILAGTQHKGGVQLEGIVEPLTKASSMGPVESKLYLLFSPSEEGRAAGNASLARISQRTEGRDPAITNETIQAQLTAVLGWGKATPDSLSRLQRIHQPTLIVNGNNDILVPTIGSYTMFQNIPNAYLFLYPDSGHGSIFQYAKLFVRETVEFLNH